MRKKKKVRVTITIDEDIYKWYQGLPRSISLSGLVNSMLRRRRAYEKAKAMKKAKLGE